MVDHKTQISGKINTILSFPLSSNKKIFLLWSIIIFALIVDTSFSNLGNLISTSSSAWKMYLYLSISIIFIVGQFFILRFLKQKSPSLRTKTKLNLDALFKVVSTVQYTLAGLIVIVILQMLVTSYYSQVILIVSIMLSYILAISMMLLLAQRFFSWFKSKKNLVILVYGLASTTIAIELGLTLLITSALFESVTRNEVGTGLLGLTPVYPLPIADAMNEINSFYVIFSISSFIITWIATALLLHHHSLKLGKVKYWTIVSLPLLYFLLQFVPLLLNVYGPLLSSNPIFDSILITLVFTLSKPVGGILFGVAFWAMARNMPPNNVVRGYLIISGYGLLLLLISDQAITLIARPYPPFGLATVSLIGFSSYLILVGIYSSAISVAADSDLRRSIRELAKRESKLLDSIGTAQMEHEIEKRVLKLAKEHEETLTSETGIELSLYEDDMKEYLAEVVQEVETIRKAKVDDQ